MDGNRGKSFENVHDIDDTNKHTNRKYSFRGLRRVIPMPVWIDKSCTSCTGQDSNIAKQAFCPNTHGTVSRSHFRSNIDFSIDVGQLFLESSVMRNEPCGRDRTFVPSSPFQETGNQCEETSVTIAMEEGRKCGVQRPAREVILVNAFTENTFVVRPERKETVSQHVDVTSVSANLTLDLLRKGMSFYVKTDCSKTGLTSSNEDILEAFCCKLPKRKHYYFYKQVKVIDLHNEQSHIQNTPNRFLEKEKLYFNTFCLIKRYVECFATLAEFTYEFTMPPPSLSSGLPNVLVVDKLWNYDKDKRVFIPTYKMLEGDSYTNYVLTRLKSLYGCDTVGFISTLHTALFANYSVLQQVTPQPPAQATPTVELPKTSTSFGPAEYLPNVQSPHTTMLSRPLKKRKLVDSTEIKPKKKVTFADEKQTNVSYKRGQAKSTTSTGGNQSAATGFHKPTGNQSTVTGFHNPTLIVFKQNFVKRQSHLICPICIEIHLSDNVVYT